MISNTLRIDASPRPGMVKVSGYVTDFTWRDMYGGPEHGGFAERIDRDVFVRALQYTPDVALLLNGAGVPLARTRTGSLRLLVDHVGLRIEAEVHAADAPRIRDGLLGYSLRITKEQWNDAYTRREIRELSLHKCAIDITSADRAAMIADMRARDVP